MPEQRKHTGRRNARGKSSTAKLLLWIGGIAAFALYMYVFYSQIVSPFTSKWQAMYGDNPEYPSDYSIHGIDISHHQGIIDWQKLCKNEIKGSPITFVIIKATEGNYLLDENFNDNFYQARENGLIRGAYHFYDPEIPAKQQAEYFLRQVHLEEGDLPPVLDIERTGNLSEKQIRKEVKTWLTIVENKYKVKPIIYTFYKFKTKYLDTPEFDAYPYWIAHYYVKKLSYKGAWKFWQHTDCGKLEGINGNVDLDIYNGSMYDLKKLTISEL